VIYREHFLLRRGFGRVWRAGEFGFGWGGYPDGHRNEIAFNLS
jgi:hypothetical protein